MGGCEIAGQADATGTHAERLQCELAGSWRADGFGGRIGLHQRHIVVEIGGLPIKGGRIGEHAGRVVVHHQAAASGFDHNAAPRGILNLDVNVRNNADEI
jgi:hypothetical protein